MRRWASATRSSEIFWRLDGVRSGRFLDTPEFTPIPRHRQQPDAFSTVWTISPTARTFSISTCSRRATGFRFPTSYDQLAQDQQQRVLTWSIAPGYQHTFSAHTLLTVNPYIRKDQFNYYASRDPFADTPATQSQNRQLLNWGVRAMLSTTRRPPQSEVRHGFEADPPAREFRLWHHRSDLQLGLRASTATGAQSAIRL